MKIISKIEEFICKRNSKTYINFLKKNGCSIGKYTHLHDPKTFYIDPNRLKYISIGDYVQITRNVTILAHDFSYSVFLNVYNDLPQKVGYTTIGNNVFIGMNSTILMGTHIGNNVVIGAGSVVSGPIPDNVVVAGNPAKVICTLDEYYNKCVNKIEHNIFEMCKFYKEKYGRYPDKKDLNYLNVFFEDKKNLIKQIDFYLYNSIEKNKIYEFLNSKEKKYKSLKEFMEEYEKKFK